MASAERPPVILRSLDLCSRAIRLARKIRSDVVSLLDSYVERQGLDKNISLDGVDSMPTAAVEHWSELTEAERLGNNLKAYRIFQTLLAEVLEDQRTHLTPTDTNFHESIQSVMLQVSALASQLEELLMLLEHSVPAREEVEGTADSTSRSMFEKKLRGLKVLQELAQWSVRSVKDLHHVTKHSHSSSTVHVSHQ
ncbi:ciliary neurotrophic factor [Alligator sinensis]|uniref:Ciliary neurotrophic factor n=1 Tax=Alligator sinensis TaxID=38654 RepID=A0A1U7S2A9_ALLSI|nr:ciliary neurotrophic factor [Alligator sinensis]